jgi:two-component system, chemotaxis family, sensor kinase CheA
MSRYLALFASEAIEHLEALGRDLVNLEKERDASAVDSMFRHAHSVKGMASSMGYEPIAVLAHRVEDLLGAVRADAGLLDRSLVDLILSASDQLLVQVRAASIGQPVDGAEALIGTLTERLRLVTGRAPGPTRVANAVATPPAAVAAPPATAPTSVPAQQSAAPPSLGLPPSLGVPPRFAVRLRIAPTSQIPGVRAFLVHRRLTSIGNVFDLRPALEDLKAGRIPDGQVSLEIETSQGEPGVRGALSNVPEVDLLSLKEIPPGAPPAPPPAAPAILAADAPRPVGHEPQRTVRVRTELLDYFLDTVAELLLATARIREVSKVLPQNARPLLEEGVDRLHGLVKDLHDKVMSARMTPLAVIMDRLPRVARDIARRRDREVDLVITGAEIELDRAIIDELSDPLLHLLRNCIDHGIESAQERAANGKGSRGRLLISVRRQRDRVVVEMEDDGRGMDPAKLKATAVQRGLITEETADRMSDREALLLSCMPGVSTASDVSEISGRGVGMDAVKRTVENLGGTLEIESQKGRGTRFTLRLPLTVAVVNLLLVQVGEEVFGLPIAKVLGASEVDGEALSRSREQLMLPWGSTLVPVYGLEDLLSVPAPRRIGGRPYVVMEGDAGRLALGVDRLLGQEEVVLKALSRPLDLLPGLSGVTILGSGRPVFILDVPRLLAA